MMHGQKNIKLLQNVFCVHCPCGHYTACLNRVIRTNMIHSATLYGSKLGSHLPVVYSYQSSVIIYYPINIAIVVF